MAIIPTFQVTPVALGKKSILKFFRPNAKTLAAALIFALAVASTASAQQDNTSAGHNALANNTTGSQNSAFGAVALFGNTSGGENSAFGAGALRFNNTGSANVGVEPSLE